MEIIIIFLTVNLKWEVNQNFFFCQLHSFNNELKTIDIVIEENISILTQNEVNNLYFR